jgi:hypothetical protein
MSKGSKKPSYKVYERRFNYLFPKPPAPQPIATPLLTDEEIDKMYPHWSKSSRAMMKKEMQHRRIKIALSALPN